MTILIGNKYELKSLLGSGTFGEVYLGINVNNDEEVAVKLDKSDISSLKNEARMYTLLKGIRGIPNIRSYGKQDDYYYLTMDRLGISIDKFILKLDGKEMMKQIFLVAKQMISILENVHKMGIIHRDIKPDNILLRYCKNYQSVHNSIYLIDFGLSKMHTKLIMKTDEKMVGTGRFVSPNIHKGITAHCRDDMISLGYVLLYLFLGKLPWQGIKCENKMEKVCELKENLDSVLTCKCDEIKNHVSICNALSYGEMPPYLKLNNLYCKALKV